MFKAAIFLRSEYFIGVFVEVNFFKDFNGINFEKALKVEKLKDFPGSNEVF